MRYNIRYYTALLLCWGLAHTLGAQQETNCDPVFNQPITQGDVVFNYGSVTNAFSFRNRTSFSIAQPVVGVSVGQNFNTQFGFWSRFLLPPQAPQVTTSQGDFPDRVLIRWEQDPLSAPASEGYVILRNGAFLGQTDAGITQFIDFNVQGGEFYAYSVFGRNQFGSGQSSSAIGFVNPNGVVTGKVETFSGNPVVGATVRLTPTMGSSLQFDGVNDYLCVTHLPVVPTDMFTASAWIKIGDTYDSDGILDLGSDLNKNFWLHTTPAGAGKGVVLGVGEGTTHQSLTALFTTTPNGWHHVTAVYGGGALILYVDGYFAGSKRVIIENEVGLITIGSRRDQTGFFDGMIDDVRLYNRPLTGTEVLLTKDITVSGATAGLVAYWKMDEGVGTKAFDLSNNDMHAFINGATFSSNTPAITNAATTDVGGFYSIEGVNYSGAQNFTATPSKVFYERYALEFNAAYESRAALTDFDLPDMSTIEITVHPFDLVARQTIMDKGFGDYFELFLEDNLYKLTVNGTTLPLGPASSAYQHLSLSLNGNTNEVHYYLNGEFVQTLTYFNLTGNWVGTPWYLASYGPGGPPSYYTGLIDEVAFYDTLLTVSTIELNASPLGNGGTDAGNPNLISYFPLDEGEGTIIDDYGPAMSGSGSVTNASFSIITYRQEEYPHSFRPSTRAVNLNASSTAATGIDFVDESTVPISGVVRFENTFCYQDSVEILVNGQSAFPKIFTDENGRFVGDFEPGVTVNLTPAFSNHVFSPGFFRARRLNRPISGVLFQNLTKREVVGKVTGGSCRLSVIPEGARVKVKVQALNDCYSQEIEIDNAAGNYRFTGLPPIPLAVSVTEHSNSVIYDYFQIQGGEEIDLRLAPKDTVDFVYIAPPNVAIQPFPENGCVGSGVKTIDQSSPTNAYKTYTTNVRVFEVYDGGQCYLDSFTLIINNDISDTTQFQIEVDTTVYPLTYWAGVPNLGGDHTKFLQATAVVNGATATAIERVVVLGERSRESTFTTASPAFPLLILRDPPGDGSSSTLASGSTHCQTWSSATMVNETATAALNVDLGAKVTTYAGTPFGGVIMESEMVAELDFTATASAGINIENATEFCLTNDVEYATTSDDAVIFGDADLYVGSAVNFEFSATDVLSYDPIACDFAIDQDIRVWPEGFGTKYIYSEWQIETDVIPSLYLIGDSTSADNWKRIVQYNQDLKNAARFRENITFDGLVSVTETQTTTSSSSMTFNTDINWTASMNETLGFEVFDVGSKVQLGISLGGGISESNGSSASDSRAVSFTLADDDPNDNFTVDIFDDPVFGTPVFKLRSGESMCPWEPGTLNREEIGFTINQLNAVNIPENDPAVFRITLSNLGQTGNDPLVYVLGAVEGANPDGAIILVDGEVLVNPLPYQLQPGESINLTLTVTKGPVAYTYNDLGIFATSKCQREHSLGLGYDLSAPFREGAPEFTGQYETDDLEKFYQEFRLDVQFIEPCSPIDISSPMEDWVITPSDGNMLSITLNEYIYDDPDLELVRVQYRRTGGDGSWINIVELPKVEFANNPVFKIVQWDMTELVDGAYEIRAITQCFDVSLAPGISKIVKGRKETHPPALLGTPQPADGVLSPGDEISITFSKRIRCDRIFQADGIGTNININNLALIDLTEGGVLVDAIISCSDDKIIIVPNVPNQYLENHTLKVIVNDIEDLYGNATDEIEWEFFVNRSNLFWSGGDINEVVFEGNSLTVTREIRNQSGQTVSYSLGNIPSWMQVFPTTGVIDPGAARIVTFTFPADLVTQAYATTIALNTVDGVEPLQVALRVACEGPNWSFDPTRYTFSMNLTVQLDIEGDVSDDPLDRIAAFVGNELRGLANVQYSPSLDRYFAFLTVYSDMAVGETVTFQIWDASDCLLYGSTVETFPYTADGFVGTPLEPQIIHTNNQLLRKIYIHPGWNWISYNIGLTDPSTNAALSSLTNPDGATIKGQTAFSSYAVLPGQPGAWYGSLSQLSHLTMYQYRSMSHDSLLLIGAPVDASTPIPIHVGWNWIGYLPQQGMPVTQALASLAPLNGDLVKGQFQFAQYVASVGWIGNLNFMSSPNGYLLRISNPGTLVYPDTGNLQPDDEGQALVAAAAPRNSPHQTYEQALRKVMLLNHWTVNPGDFEFSMNLIGIVHASEAANALSEGDEIAAFVDGEVRGTSQVLYVESLDSYMVFLTIYANREGENLQFKWYDQSAQSEVPLVENFSFLINSLMGSVAEPFAFHTTTTSVQQAVDAAAALSVFPNPAKDHVYFRFDANVNESIAIRVTDALGREVGRLTTEALGIRHTLEWNTRHLAAGLYVVTLHRADGSQVRQMFQVSK